MKSILTALATVTAIALSLFPAACHSQVPPTVPTVTLTIAPPSSGCGSGSPACTYVISRALVPSASTACPAATGTAYAPLNQSSPVAGPTYVDSTATGDFACYIAQTIQTESGQTTPSVSGPSNIVGPETVPAQPTAPNLSGTVVGANKAPQIGPDQKQMDAWVKMQNESEKPGHFQVAPPLLTTNGLTATVTVASR